MENTWKKLEQVLGVSFRDRNLLMTAVTHTSYANEHRQEEARHNERLEYLGDAVLELVTSQFLYVKYPSLPEGILTKKRASLVCEPTLAFCAREFDLPSFLLLGKGEELTGGRQRDSIVSDATEALLGAIYLDGGFESARRFVEEHILNDVEHKQLFYDSKTILQEMIQEKGMNAAEYHLLKEEGPDHDKKFSVNVVVDGDVLGAGTGHTKKAAEQAAAYQAIRVLMEKVCI
ncbi:MAG: ribonuclease III [Blautia sp.]|nr:ribonuclease III [Blautia sp.]